MIDKSIAEMILRGQSLRLTTYDENGFELRILQRNLCSLGRQSGVGCNIIPHKTKKGDLADIRIDNVLLQHQSHVVSLLNQTSLIISIEVNGEDKLS